jgi:hypothetical protein
MKPSKPFKISLILISSPVALLLLCILTGFIVDRTSKPRLDAMKRASLQKLQASLPAGSDNAWQYYEEAIDLARNIRPDADRQEFIFGKISITPEIKRSIEENHDVLEFLKSGSAQPHCVMLLDYRSGMFRRNPNLRNLRIISQVLGARALYELETGDNKRALEDIFALMIIAKHIAVLSPTVLDQINAVSLLHWGSNIFSMGISSGTFSQSELDSSIAFLATIEKEWPPLYITLEKQIAALKIYIASSSLSETADLVLLPHRGKTPSPLLRLLVRVRYWRFLFSPRQAFIAHFEFLDSIVAEMKQIEETNASRGSWHVEQVFPQFFQERIDLHRGRVRIPEIFTPKFTNIGLLFNLTKIRLLHSAALVAKYREETGSYPHDLSGFDIRIMTDPNTGIEWEYRILEDSAFLMTHGLYLNATYDDIIIPLTRKGIADYLLQKRKNSNAE